MKKLSDIWIDKIDEEDYCMAEDPIRGGINQIARQAMENEITVSKSRPTHGTWFEEVATADIANDITISKTPPLQGLWLEEV